MSEATEGSLKQLALCKMFPTSPLVQLQLQRGEFMSVQYLSGCVRAVRTQGSLRLFSGDFSRGHVDWLCF